MTAAVQRQGMACGHGPDAQGCMHVRETATACLPGRDEPPPHAPLPTSAEHGGNAQRGGRCEQGAGGAGCQQASRHFQQLPVACQAGKPGGACEPLLAIFEGTGSRQATSNRQRHRCVGGCGAWRKEVGGDGRAGGQQRASAAMQCCMHSQVPPGRWRRLARWHPRLYAPFLNAAAHNWRWRQQMAAFALAPRPVARCAAKSMA